MDSLPFSGRGSSLSLQVTQPLPSLELSAAGGRTRKQMSDATNEAAEGLPLLSRLPQLQWDRQEMNIVHIMEDQQLAPLVPKFKALSISWQLTFCG